MNAETRERLRQAVSDRRRLLVKAPTNPESIAKQARRRNGLVNVSTHNRGGYCNGCRCDACCAAHRVYNASRSRARRAS